MSEQTKEINIIELLMGIKEDVSSIKTDIANFKEAQRIEKENTTKELDSLRVNYKRDLVDLEAKMTSKINGIISVQNNIVGDVDTLKNSVETLKNADLTKDAKRWRSVLGYIGTAIGSMFVVKLPDIIRTLYMIFLNNGGGK